MKTICRDALLHARDRFATAIPLTILEALNNTVPVEPSARFLSGGRFRLMVDNVLAMDNWQQRIGWARQLAFPPASSMRGKYPDAAVTWLPILYMRRALDGLLRLIVPRDASQRH